MRRPVNLAYDHPVAVKVVRKQTFDPDCDRLIFGHGEAGIGQRGGNRAHAQVDFAGINAIAAIRQRVADRRRAVVSAQRGVADVALRIERGQPVFAAINRDDPQHIAIGIEIVTQHIDCLDHQFGAGNGREDAIIQRRRGPVVEQLTQRFLGPGNPVGEGVALNPGRVGVQRIDHRQAVSVVAGKADHHCTAAAIQSLNCGVGGSQAQELHGIRAAGAGIGNGVVARAGPEGIAITGSPARQQIVASPRGETVRPVKAIGIVIAAAVDIGQSPGPHRIAVPDRTIGKAQGQRITRLAIGNGERADQYQTVPRAREGHHQIVAVWPGAHRGADIRQVVIAQFDHVRARNDAFDAVIAIAAAIDIGIGPGSARDQIVAQTGGDPVSARRADDRIIAIGGKAAQDCETDIGQGIAGPIGQCDGFDTR